MTNPSDRRKFRRVRAPVLCRPMGKRLLQSGDQQPQDISHGGLRVYSDEPIEVGSRLEIELFLPDGGSAVLEVEVVWVEALPPGGAACHDVGLKFTSPANPELSRLDAVLESA